MPAKPKTKKPHPDYAFVRDILLNKVQASMEKLSQGFKCHAYWKVRGNNLYLLLEAEETSDLIFFDGSVCTMDGCVDGMNTRATYNDTTELLVKAKLVFPRQARTFHRLLFERSARQLGEHDLQNLQKHATRLGFDLVPGSNPNQPRNAKPANRPGRRHLPVARRRGRVGHGFPENHGPPAETGSRQGTSGKNLSGRFAAGRHEQGCDQPR